jgi:hypothetical protein
LLAPTIWRENHSAIKLSIPLLTPCVMLATRALRTDEAYAAHNDHPR